PPDRPSPSGLPKTVYYPASPCSPSASSTEEVELAEEAERVLCPSPISDLSTSLSSTDSYESTASVEVLPTKSSTTRKWPYWMKSLAASVIITHRGLASIGDGRTSASGGAAAVEETPAEIVDRRTPCLLDLQESDEEDDVRRSQPPGDEHYTA